MYDRGHCIAQNGQSAVFLYRQAVASWRMAAEEGDRAAQCNLGFAYEHGQGVERDWILAVFWYRMAAEHGHEKARRYYNTALDKVALNRESDPDRTFINLDDLLKLDEMLRNAGLDGVDGWGDLNALRIQLNGH